MLLKRENKTCFFNIFINIIYEISHIMSSSYSAYLGNRTACCLTPGPIGPPGMVFVIKQQPEQLLYNIQQEQLFLLFQLLLMLVVVLLRSLVLCRTKLLILHQDRRRLCINIYSANVFQIKYNIFIK